MYEIWQIFVNLTIDRDSASAVSFDSRAILVVVHVGRHTSIPSIASTMGYHTVGVPGVNEHDINYLSYIFPRLHRLNALYSSFFYFKIKLFSLVIFWIYFE